jgi:predicted RNase H-like HicB family nuclease
MSANNELMITKSYGEWVVTERDIDTGVLRMPPLGRGKTLEEAVKIANEFMEENEVEYGLNIPLEEPEDSE